MSPSVPLRVDGQGRARCWWPGDAPDYLAYHDDEWGRPVVDDRRLLEKLALEGFQSGLSWITILRKRENFRRAFAGFDPATVAQFGADDVDRLLGDAGIVRHRGKIEATINNAQRCVDLIDEFGSLAAYIWTFEPADRDSAVVPVPLPSQTPDSVRLSKDLKRRGWRFVGPTTVYAFMQAMGLVNDHAVGCEWRAICATARKSLTLP
jgi:DNA-3-methyladenine glycosylase I